MTLDPRLTALVHAWRLRIWDSSYQEFLTNLEAFAREAFTLGQQAAFDECPLPAKESTDD